MLNWIGALSSVQIISSYTIDYCEVGYGKVLAVGIGIVDIIQPEKETRGNERKM